MISIPFFTPGVIASSIGVSCFFKPLTTAIYGVTGAIQGAVGVYALTTLGYEACSIATAATIGGLAGAAIAAPFAIAIGFTSIFDAPQQSFFRTIAGFALEIGVMFLASLVLSTAFYLGTLPATTIVAGALVTNAAIAVVKDAVSFGISRIRSED